ncbi:hypothetical protein Pelo_17045 [Pelomyxa schiedti]|nr:hypothetical protein Pelo_17045 [Pelomyxa schiedti]
MVRGMRSRTLEVIATLFVAIIGLKAAAVFPSDGPTPIMMWSDSGAPVTSWWDQKAADAHELSLLEVVGARIAIVGVPTQLADQDSAEKLAGLLRLLADVGRPSDLRWSRDLNEVYDSLEGPTRSRAKIPGHHGLRDAWQFFVTSGESKEHPVIERGLMPVKSTVPPSPRSTAKWHHDIGTHEGALRYDSEDQRLQKLYGPPGFSDTSSYMLGTTAYVVIFVDGPKYQWTQSSKNTGLAKAATAMDWWSNLNVNAFAEISVYQTAVTIDIDMCDYASTQDDVMRTRVMAALGYSSERAYANALRDNYGTDWALFLYAVTGCSTFTNGYFGYAYLGGPSVVITEQCDGWGLDNWDKVLAHENGHSFQACDEYCDPGYSCCSCTDVCGWVQTTNPACEAACVDLSEGTSCLGDLQDETSDCMHCTTCNTEACMMKSNDWNLCSGTRAQVGWIDTNSNGIYDPIDDNIPEVTVSSIAQGHSPVIAGTATNPNTAIISDWVASVQYRVLLGETVIADWQDATPDDGTFDSDTEDFTITYSGTLSDGVYTFDIQAGSRFNIWSGGGLSVPVCTCSNSPGLCEADYYASCSGTTCTYEANSGASCDDGDDCTGGDTCTAEKLCVGGISLCSSSHGVSSSHHQSSATASEAYPLFIVALVITLLAILL